MANHKSAKKRARQTIVRTENNKVKRSVTRNLVKKMSELISKDQKDEAKSLLPKLQSNLAKARKNGSISTNSARRKTSRMSRKV